MFKSVLVGLFILMPVNAYACYNSGSGDIREYSNKNDISVTDRGSTAETNQYSGGYWSVIEGEGGTVFRFSVSMNQDQSNMLGVLLSFHTDKRVDKWEAGHSESFKSYKSLGVEVNEVDYGQFSCGVSKVHAGYFGSQITDKTGNSVPERLWYLDSDSSAELSVKKIRSDSFVIDGNLNLVYLNPLSERWKNGGKLNQAGEKREVSIKLDGVQFMYD